MQTQATSAVLNFVQGFIGDENEDNQDEETPDCRELMGKYTKPLLQALVELLKKGIQAKHEPLQTEVLNVLHSICSVILSDFGVYYNDFMPLMTEILQNVGSESMEDKKLRAKTIDCMGSIIIAVSDCDNKEVFKSSVVQVTDFLAQTL